MARGTNRRAKRMSLDKKPHWRAGWWPTLVNERCFAAVTEDVADCSAEVIKTAMQTHSSGQASPRRLEEMCVRWRFLRTFHTSWQQLVQRPHRVLELRLQRKTVPGCSRLRHPRLAAFPLTMGFVSFCQGVCHLGERGRLVLYYYYYAVFNAPCVGRLNDEIAGFDFAAGRSRDSGRLPPVL